MISKGRFLQNPVATVSDRRNPQQMRPAVGDRRYRRGVLQEAQGYSTTNEERNCSGGLRPPPPESGTGILPVGHESQRWTGKMPVLLSSGLRPPMLDDVGRVPHAAMTMLAPGRGPGLHGGLRPPAVHFAKDFGGQRPPLQRWIDFGIGSNQQVERRHTQ